MSVNSKKRSSIKKRVIYVNLILFAVLLGQGIYSYFASSGIESNSESIKTKKFPAVTLVNELNVQVKELYVMLEDVITSDAEEAYDLDEVDWNIFNSGLSNDSIFSIVEIYEAKEAVNKIIHSLAIVDSISVYSDNPMIDSLRVQFPKFKKGYASLFIPKIREVQPEIDDDEGRSEETDEASVNPVEEIKKLFTQIDNYRKTTNEEITENFEVINTQARTFFKTTIVIFGFLVIILTGFLFFFSAITKALIKLSNDANIIREGNLNHEIVCDRNDELGVLQLSFDLMRKEVKDFIENLDQKVQERTREVNEEKRKISNLLNNMKQAVFKVDMSKKVTGPMSAYTNRVFNEDIIGKSIFDTVYTGIDQKSEVGVAINSAFVAAFGEGELQWELSEDNLPVRVERQLSDDTSQTLKLNYAPLWNDNEELEELMFVVEDITELEVLAKENTKSEENIRMIQSISNCNIEDLKNYFTSTASLLQNSDSILLNAPYDEQDFALLFRNLHTIKGNSRIYTLHLVGAIAHGVENFVTQGLQLLKEGRAVPNEITAVIAKGLEEIQASLNKYADVGREVFKVSLDGQELISIDGFVHNVSTIKVLSKNFKELEDLLKSFEEEEMDRKIESILEVFHSLYEVDVKSSFYKYRNMINEVADTMDKKVEFEIVGDEVSLEKQKLEVVHTAVVHLLRNAIDHGIESPDERLAKGKNETGAIKIKFKLLPVGFSLSIVDDGAGIPIEKLYAKAIESGSLSINEPRVTQKEKLNLMYLPNVSTKDGISELSGRGIGMDIVRKAVEQISGDLEVSSENDKGTTFTLTIV